MNTINKTVPKTVILGIEPKTKLRQVFTLRTTYAV